MSMQTQPTYNSMFKIPYYRIVFTTTFNNQGLLSLQRNSYNFSKMTEWEYSNMDVGTVEIKVEICNCLWLHLILL